MKLLRKFHRDESPLRTPSAIGHGVTVGAGGVWAWAEIPARSTDEEDGETLVELTVRAGSDLATIIPAGAEFHKKIMWRTTSGDDYFAAQDRPGLSDGQLDYLRMGAARIDQLAFPERLVLLGVRVDRHAPGFESAAAKVRRVTGSATPADEAGSMLDEATIREVRTFLERMARSTFQGRPASPQLLAWALRRDLHRIVERIPDGALIAGGQLPRLLSTHVVPAMDHVLITTAAGPRFVRLVTTAESGFPAATLTCPGSEWLKDLDLVSGPHDPAEPVEVSIRGRNVTAAAAGKRIKDAITLTKEQSRAAEEGNAEEAPAEVEEARRSLEERKASGESMVEDGVTWIVEATDLETLDRRTSALIDYYGNPRLDITLWAPPGDQDLLWKQTVIGDGRRVEEFDNFRPMTTLAAAWDHGGSVVGAESGLFLASNVGSSPGPYLDRLSDAQLSREAVTTLFLGTTGAGKTTAAGLSLIGEAVMGAFTLMTDFKGDAGGVAKVCEMLGVPVTRVSTAELSSGTMDPYRYVPNVDEATSMVVDILSSMLSVREDVAESALITRAAHRVTKLPPTRRSIHAVIAELAASADEDEGKIGERLSFLALDPLARPVAGVPDFRAPQLPLRAGFAYVAFEGLRWPGEDVPRDQWVQGERLTMMLVGAAFTYITHQAGRVKGIPKVIALTELHQLTRYAAGRTLVGTLARQGSALDVNLLLDTQAAAELLKVEGLPDQVSTVHAFRVTSDAEADAQAVLLGLPPSAALRARQKGHGKGRCLTRDRRRRVAAIQFDYLCEEIELALDTRPKRDAPALLAVPTLVEAEGATA